tara:strand:+ start:2942 stop:3808 length:867 start_codon:yes stop_codon:yes gene_type:complete
MEKDIKKELHKNGYVIIKNILTEDEIDEYREYFFKWKDSIENFDELHKKINPHYIYKYHQVGHQRFAWKLRINPKIQNVFKELWDTSELVVSFDGCCYMPKHIKNKDSYWTHTDQSQKKKGLHCYQAFVSLTSNKEKTLVVYEKSHLLHESYFTEMNLTENKDWNVIDKDYLEKIKDNKKILHVPAGSLVIWDSRTFHQNQYGKKNTEERIVQYVSYLPKNNPKNTTSMRAKRQKYFEEKRTTSHWAYPIKVNSLQPRHYGNKDLLIDYDSLPEIELDTMMGDIQKLL